VPLPAGRGVGRGLSLAATRPSRAVARDPPVDLIDSANLGPTDYANRRAHDPAPRAMVWLAILILYVVWGSTYLGSGSRSSRFRRSSWRRRGSCSPA
jgi:hypothetical protein